MIFALLGSVALLLSVGSCKKDTTIRYGNDTFGNITDGVLITDQGNIFNIVEQTCAGKIDTMERVYTITDILRETEGGKEKEYDVRLVYVVEPLCKDMKIKSELTEEEETELGNDPIHLAEGWFSGGYFNAIVFTEYEVGSKVKHLINIVVDDTKDDDKLHLTLRHNAYGETNSEISNSDNKIVIGQGIVTFPIADLIPEGKEKMDIIFTYSWYEDDSSTEVEEKTIEGTYEKGEFEHTPKKVRSIVKSIELK